MGFKSLFIKEEENETQNNGVQPQQMNVVSQPTPVVNIEPQPVVTSIPVQQVVPTVDATEVNTDIVSTIWDIIIGKNLPGPDYIEFKNTIAGLVDVIPDEQNQFKGAFNVLKRSYPAFTKEDILKSIDTYISIVEEERRVGQEECKNKRDTQIGDKQKQVENIKLAISEVDKQIEDIMSKKAELEKKKTELNSQISPLLTEISTAEESIKKEEQIFTNSVNNVIQKLSTDKSKVTTMIV